MKYISLKVKIKQILFNIYNTSNKPKIIFYQQMLREVCNCIAKYIKYIADNGILLKSKHGI